jgi:hypothetical protein
MTPSKLKRFNELGCVSKCLMHLSAEKGRPITTEEYCSQFEGLFVDPINDYGLLDVGGVLSVLAALQLGTLMEGEPDYDATVGAFHQDKRQVLIASMIDLNPGQTDVKRHCSVLKEIDADRFSLWSPSQDGSSGILPPFLRKDWDAKQCSAIVLG